MEVVDIDTKKLLPKHTEFETKYRIDGNIIYDFKALVQKFPGGKDLIYIESDDIYYTCGDDFARYRFSNFKKDKRAEVTWKYKTSVDDNFNRKEFNWRVDETPISAIEGALEAWGFKRNFRISKIVHIYKFPDATIPFYTVIDESGKIDHFIEIEVDEDKIHTMTSEEAWSIIRKYEELLSPIGISAQKRLRKSLYEMYRR